MLAQLNRQLRAWGYEDDPRNAVSQIKQTINEMSSDADARYGWQAAQEEWIGEGDDLLDAVEDAVRRLGLENICEDEKQGIWRSATAAAFKVQWLLVASEVSLDLLD